MVRTNNTVPAPRLPPNKKPKATTDTLIPVRIQPTGRPAGQPHQPRHQPVARTGPEPRPDVSLRCDAVDDDPEQQPGDSPPQRRRSRNPAQEQVQARSDDEDVADRANTGLLPHGDPQEQDQHPDDDRPLPDAEPEVFGQPLVQDVPGYDAEPGLDEQRLSESKGDEPDIQLDEPSGRTATTEVRRAWKPTAPGSRTRSEG